MNSYESNNILILKRVRDSTKIAYKICSHTSSDDKSYSNWGLIPMSSSQVCWVTASSW